MISRACVMYDIETLGTERGYIILSLGAVAYDPYLGQLGKEFYSVFNPVESMKMGFKQCKRTLDWWTSDPERHESYKALMKKCNNEDIDNAWVLKAFSNWIYSTAGEYAKSKRFGSDQPIPVELWSNGFMDYEMLHEYYQRHKIDFPVLYWAVRDFRTYRESFPDEDYMRSTKPKTVSHVAWQDAQSQAEHHQKLVVRANEVFISHHNLKAEQ